MTIAEVLKQKRKELDLGVKQVVIELAKYGISISAKTIYSWESGHRKPDADTFIVLCDIYKVENIKNAFSNVELRNTIKTNNIDTTESKPYSTQENQLLTNYRSLNEEGQEKVSEYADDLVFSGRYKKRDPLCMDTQKEA